MRAREILAFVAVGLLVGLPAGLFFGLADFFFGSRSWSGAALVFAFTTVFFALWKTVPELWRHRRRGEA